MSDRLPDVAVVIAAYNEKDCLPEKIQNCFELDYPADRVTFHFVTDGSTDHSEAMLSNLQGLVVHHSPERRGKLAAVERVVKKLQSEIIVLTDANCLLNTDALKQITKHYEDPRVGGVAGEKSVRREGSSSSQGEGLYWRYESWLKKIDSELNTVVGAAGELFSFRRILFEELPSDTIIEDFVLSMRIAMKGYRVVYEPKAVASEFASASIGEEWKRKVRICAGGFQALKYLPGILNPFRYGWLSIQYFSHRFLRWFVIPFVLPSLIILSALLATRSSFYLVLFIGELLALLAGTFALYASGRINVPKVLLIPGYLLMMNAAAYAGLARYLKGSQSSVWEKSKRSTGI